MRAQNYLYKSTRSTGPAGRLQCAGLHEEQIPFLAQKDDKHDVHVHLKVLTEVEGCQDLSHATDKDCSADPLYKVGSVLYRR